MTPEQYAKSWAEAMTRAVYASGLAWSPFNPPHVMHPERTDWDAAKLLAELAEEV